MAGKKSKYGKIVFLIGTVYLLLSSPSAFGLSGQSLKNLFGQGKYAGLHTAAKEFYMSENEKYVVALCNLVRFDPRGFLRDVILSADLDTNQSDIKNLMSELKVRKSVFPLMPAFSLYKSSFIHAKDMGFSGLEGHTGSNGQKFEERVRQFFPSSAFIAENYYQGSGEPVDIVMSFLLEKGEQGKAYRNNLLSEDIHYIGISIQPHRSRCTNAVLDFARKPNLASTSLPKKKDPSEIYWKDCPKGTKIVTKRKSGGFSLLNLFGGRK
jgi:uncharacterized protein YkwD